MGSWSLGRWEEGPGRPTRDSLGCWTPQGHYDNYDNLVPLRDKKRIMVPLIPAGIHFTSLALHIKSSFYSTTSSSFLLSLSCCLLNYTQFLAAVLLFSLFLLPSSPFLSGHRAPFFHFLLSHPRSP